MLCNMDENQNFDDTLKTCRSSSSLSFSSNFSSTDKRLDSAGWFFDENMTGGKCDAEPASRIRSGSWSHQSRTKAADVALKRAIMLRKTPTVNVSMCYTSADDLQKAILLNNNNILKNDTPLIPVSLAKHVHTQHIVSKHSLKTHSANCQRLLEDLFLNFLADAQRRDDHQSVVQHLEALHNVMHTAWRTPKIGFDLAVGLCDYMRENGFLDLLIARYILEQSQPLRVVMAGLRALNSSLTVDGRMHIMDRLPALVSVVKSRLVAPSSTDEEKEENGCLLIGVSFFEQLFKMDAATNAHLIDMTALDYCLQACQASRDTRTHRHAAVALANLSMNSDHECQQKIIAKNVPDWLYFLASSRDDATRYYACLATCVLVSNKEIEASVVKSGSLRLVEPFLCSIDPATFASSTGDFRHQGRPKEWLLRLVPMLYAKRREPRSMAAFHLAMDACIKRDQDRLDVFKEIGAVEALRQSAAMPDEAASKFARIALEIIGERAPYKLTAQVPMWTMEDVQYWVTQIGFEKFSNAFKEQRVDGDLLLLLTEEELEHDIGIKSGLLRKRFMRELESLKMAADYSCVDGTRLDRFLANVNPQFSIYTYPLLEIGMTDCRMLHMLNPDVLRNQCHITNPVHRLKLMNAVDEFKHMDDMEVAALKKHIDIFISYRRNTGSQLASLLKVLLQLRGYKVFLDVDRLYAGHFDSSLLKSIQAADHFVLVLTPQSLDRCVDDNECGDWVHKEIACALKHNKNIISVLDPHFIWPELNRLPNDVQRILEYNKVQWEHEYQNACIGKLIGNIKDYANANRNNSYIQN